MATILKEETLVRSQAVVARVVSGETLIIPVRDSVGDLASIYSLDSTGSLIWKFLGSPRTVTQLAMAFAQEYEVEPEMVRQDVADFLNEMMEVGMVELRNFCDAAQDSTPCRTIDTAAQIATQDLLA